MVRFKGIHREQWVRLATQAYPIIIGHHILKEARVLRSYLASQQVMIVTDQFIASYYLPYLQSACSDKQCDITLIQQGEEAKNKNSLFLIYDNLIKNKHNRDTTLVALGGGLIGDITGFAAATYQRGVRLVHIPTTLLAQVDASIGGKTGINYHYSKNVIGCFYQPQAVLIDLSTLISLDKRHFNSGCAEIIKMAILAGGELFNRVLTALKQGLTACSAQLVDIIRACCLLKAQYIEQDPIDTDLRKLLNLGHTFAHALESYGKYTRWLHGEAVAIGLYCAALLSQYYEGLDEKTVALIVEMLRLAQLPYAIPKDVDIYQLYQLMGQDKKIEKGQLHFILIKSLGHCYITNEIKKDILFSILKQAKEYKDAAV